MPERLINHNLQPVSLPVPEALLPNDFQHLPNITLETLRQLKLNGWNKAGIMVAFVDTDGAVLMQTHRGRLKNLEGALGPLGETLKPRDNCRFETPLQGLSRGISEEWAIHEPDSLKFETFQTGGWVINQWPAGLAYPGVYNCAVSYPVFVSDDTKAQILETRRPTNEVSDVMFMQPYEIFDMADDNFRSGVKPWLSQLQEAGLLDPTSRPLTVLNQPPLEQQAYQWQR